VSSTWACVNVELQFGQRNAQLLIKAPPDGHFSARSTLSIYRENFKILDYCCEFKEIYVFAAYGSTKHKCVEEFCTERPRVF